MVVYGAAWFDLIAAMPESRPILSRRQNIVMMQSELSVKLVSKALSSVMPEALQEITCVFRASAAG